MAKHAQKTITNTITVNTFNDFLPNIHKHYDNSSVRDLGTPEPVLDLF